MRFTIESLTSREIVAKLNDFDIDVGLTYVDGEPLGRVRVIPLYRERYVFVTPVDGPFAEQASVTWAEAAQAPLCLLVPSMQNRRIIDGYFADHGLSVTPVVETDTVSAMYAHLAVMKLSSIRALLVDRELRPTAGRDGAEAAASPACPPRRPGPGRPEPGVTAHQRAGRDGARPRSRPPAEHLDAAAPGRARGRRDVDGLRGG